MGWLGAQVQINVQAILSDHHGEARATALTEANIAASLSASISPLFIALCVTFGLSWRTALFFQPIALAILAVVFWRVSLPSRIRPSGNIQEKPAIKLPSLYWLCWTAIILFVAIEWCLMVWGADYMVSDQGLNPAQAAAVMSVYAIVSVAGRVIGSRLTISIPVSDILILALVSCAIGFPVFWLINLPGLAIIGFLLAGIGIANLFPMAMTLAIGAAPDQTDLASTRISLAVGIAGLSAPLLLGWLADQSGISLAYGIVFVFILIGFVLAREIRSRNHSRPKPENDQQQAL
jgi:fucose permease